MSIQYDKKPNGKIFVTEEHKFIPMGHGIDHDYLFYFPIVSFSCNHK
jgi:hypothetical protein